MSKGYESEPTCPHCPREGEVKDPPPLILQARGFGSSYWECPVCFCKFMPLGALAEDNPACWWGVKLVVAP